MKSLIEVNKRKLSCQRIALGSRLASVDLPSKTPMVLQSSTQETPFCAIAAHFHFHSWILPGRAAKRFVEWTPFCKLQQGRPSRLLGETTAACRFTHKDWVLYTSFQSASTNPKPCIEIRGVPPLLQQQREHAMMHGVLPCQLAFFVIISANDRGTAGQGEPRRLLLLHAGGINSGQLVAGMAA